jgi:hypothetical protein
VSTAPESGGSLTFPEPRPDFGARLRGEGDFERRSGGGFVWPLGGFTVVRLLGFVELESGSPSAEELRGTWILASGTLATTDRAAAGSGPVWDGSSVRGNAGGLGTTGLTTLADGASPLRAAPVEAEGEGRMLFPAGFALTASRLGLEIFRTAGCFGDDAVRGGEGATGEGFCAVILLFDDFRRGASPYRESSSIETAAGAGIAASSSSSWATAVRTSRRFVAPDRVRGAII